MKKYSILLILLVAQLLGYAQTTLFSVIQEPGTLSGPQLAVKNYVLNSPRLGGIQFVQFAQADNVQQNGQIRLSIAGVNNNQQIVFQVSNATFEDPTHYSIQGKSSLGSLTLYFTPEGIGGTIDLVSRLFSIYPISETRGILFENRMTSTETTICKSDLDSQHSDESRNFCEGDCGAAVLDLLLLISPEASTWLSTNFGWLAGWFLFVEGNNMNTAFVNSAIPNKRVRVTTANLTPDFTWSALTFVDNRIDADIASVSNSAAVLGLRNSFRADIVVVLTNNNYTGPTSNGQFGTIFGVANSLDPLSNNKACIAQVSSIGPVRYTLAHEVAHQFGCLHSNPLSAGCPHGKNMANGRNTIMANNANDNTRIQHYSNPSINFGGEATGNVGTRDNAQQIRAAFCESANNNTIPTYSADFFQFGSICPGNPVTFISNVTSGLCENFLGYLEPCGVAPYQYQWTISPFANFSWSQVVGSGPTLQINPICPVFYMRLKVTSSDGLVTTVTRMFLCGNCFQGGSEERQSDPATPMSSIQVMPNPASDEIKISASNAGEITGVTCYNLQGVKFDLPYSKVDDLNSVVVSVRSLKSGMYVFRVFGAGYEQSVKVIVNSEN
jgi:hypothetical protein